jgi:hypothetical protein
LVAPGRPFIHLSHSISQTSAETLFNRPICYWGYAARGRSVG